MTDQRPAQITALVSCARTLNRIAQQKRQWAAGALAQGKRELADKWIAEHDRKRKDALGYLHSAMELRDVMK